MGACCLRNRLAGIYRAITQNMWGSKMYCSRCCRYDMVFVALSFHFTEGFRSTNSVIFFSCIIESYIYSYLIGVTDNNIVSAMTYHFVWNLLVHIVAINPADNNGNIFPYIILVVLETLALFAFWSVRKAKTIVN